MVSDPPMELRVSRLENDNTAIYDLISEIQSTQQAHSRRFDRVDAQLDSIGTTLAEVLRRLPDAS